jgi:hypothetical protein
MPYSKVILPITSKEKHYQNLRTSSNIKILNPLIPFNSKLSISTYDTYSKAHDVMSPIPPQSLYHSNIRVSRLSPISPLSKPMHKKSSTYLPKHAAELILSEKVDFSVDFTRPVRDYFSDSNSKLKNRGSFVSFKESLCEIEEVPKMTEKNREIPKESQLLLPEIRVKEPKYLKPKYASSLLSPPQGPTQKVLTKALNRIEVVNKKTKAVIFSDQFTTQGFQTDTNTFEWDDWELDYDA